MGGLSSKQQFELVLDKLAKEDIDPGDHEFWSEVWKTTLSCEEIFDAASPDAVRAIMDRPQNLQTLFSQAVAQLYQIVETPYPVYFNQALNCARVLARVLPIMLEQKGQPDIHRFCWTKNGREDDAESSSHKAAADPLSTQEPLAVAALLWAPGVGSPQKSVTCSSQFDRNRIEVLRVMLGAFCDPLYTAPSSFDPCSSFLLNTVLVSDTALPLMECSLHVLLILLDFGHSIRVEGPSNDSPGFNVFRRELGNIQSKDELHFIFRGFVRLLNNIPQSDRSYLPFSHTRVSAEQELLVLLWKCIEEIPRFLPYVIKNCDVTELLVPICYFMLEGRRDSGRAGLVYLCTFTILKLSGERSFGVALNKAYTLELPVDIPLFTGSHADLLIAVIYKLIFEGHEKLASLYNCFLTIICNVSPYCKTLNSSSSAKLCNLLSLFASNRFMLGGENNYHFVVLILEALNNIVQYQYQGNDNVVFSLLRLKNVIDSLSTLDLLKLKALRNSILQNSSGHARQNSAGGGDDVDVAGDTQAAPTKLVDVRSVRRNPDGDVPTDASELEHRMSESADTAANKEVEIWEPDQQWFDRVRAELPLETLVRLHKHLLPQIEGMSTKGKFNEEKAKTFIRESTMVGLLPVPHPIVIRKYQPNTYTTLWFSAFLWGVLFVRNRNPPMFDGKNVQLFTVQGEQESLGVV
eukprot:GSChrysophyteH1.ASY1.ANO1.2178.1 assembled CDS